MKRKIAIAVIIGALAAPAVAEPGVVGQLEGKARYWEERGRIDRAAEAWEKVLRSSPDHPEARVSLGIAAARAGRDAEARTHLERLRITNPAHPGLAQLEQAVAIGGRYGGLLAGARAHVGAGRLAEAVAAYRQIVGRATPPRDIALEYYQTIGGTDGGWPESRAGLERLHGSAPRSARVRLALGQLLTWRDETRRQGIRHLQDLASNPEVAETAKGSWRQALLWLEATAADAALFEAYIARHPLDADVEKRLSELRRAAPRRDSVSVGFEALERADLGAAEKSFRAADGPDALVGRAVIALKQGRFAEARDLLLRVKQLVPQRPEAWERSLRSATFWALVEEARAARKANHPEAAEAKLLEAIEASPEERHHAELQLADLRFSQERLPEAEALLRRVLEKAPEDEGALQGLIHLLVRAGRTTEAVAANEKLSRLAPERAYRRGWIESEKLRGEASRHRAASDFDQARAALVEARAVDPKNEWVLHDLADLHLEQEELAEARKILDELLAVAPRMHEIRLIQVRLFASEGQTAAALDLLAASEPLEGELLRWRRRLEIRAAIDRAAVKVKGVDPLEASRKLQQLQWETEKDPELSLLVAEGWARIGDEARAMALVDDVTLRTPELAVSQRLQIAAILFELQAERQLVDVLRGLAADPRLRPSERRALESLRVGYAVRRADALRELGEYQRAFGQLSPVVQDYPDNGSLLCAVARLYRSSGDARQAHAVYARVLANEPGRVDARRGAVETAIELRLIDQAEALADEGMRLAPKDPEMHLVAARVAIADGSPREGMDLLQMGEALAEGTGTELADETPVLDATSSTSDLLRHATQRFTKGAPAVQDRAGVLGEIRDEMGRIKSAANVKVHGTAQIRHREGEPGLGAVDELSLPVELEVPLGYSTSVALKLQPTMLSAGDVSLEGDAATRWGRGLSEGALPTSAFGATALGVALRTGSLAIDVGSTPLGFAVENVQGGLAWRWEGQGVGFRIDVGRRPVIDSLLSYGGVEDPASGEVWGGVMRTGGRADLAFVGDEATWYLVGGYQLFQGENVADNRAFEVGAGVEWKLHEWQGETVTAGLNVTGLGYEKNLRYFTFGHGGYFSPQAFVRAGVPIRWQGSREKLTWTLDVDPGFNWFREDAAPFYPLAEPADRGELYEQKTSMSFSLNAMPRIGWRFGDALVGGAKLDLHTAEDYTEVIGGFFVEGAFIGRKGR